MTEEEAASLPATKDTMSAAENLLPAAEHFMTTNSAMEKLDQVATLFAEAKGIAISDAVSLIDWYVTNYAMTLGFTFEVAVSMIATKSPTENLSAFDECVDRIFTDARYDL